MSNVPGDLSADPSGETLPADVIVAGTVLPLQGETEVPSTIAGASQTANHPIDEKLPFASDVTLPTEKGDKPFDDDDQDDDDDDRTHVGGIKLRDLSGSHVEQFPGIKREKWWQIWRPLHAPPPPKASLDDAEVIPLAYVSILSKLTFHWVTPIMTMGYQRPLQATDLWKMDPSREAHLLSTLFVEKLSDRQRRAAEWNASLKSRAPRWSQKISWNIQACLHRSLPKDFECYGGHSTVKERRQTLEEEWRRRSGMKRGSVTWALNDVMTGFWAGGLFKVFGDTAQLMTPLVIKALINLSKEVYTANHNGTPQPNIGRGVGMALGLWGLVIMQSICQHQFFFRSMAMGVLTRAALISAIYKRSLSLSIGSRAQHPNGKLINHLSSDISRIDYCAQWFHAIWTSPIQIIVTLILLLVQIGPSAVVGFSLFILIGPLQTWFMKMSFLVRKKSIKWTDGRSKLLRELLSSMQIIKVFTYEVPFLKRLRFIRRKEMVGIRKILIIRAANQAMAFSIPTLASVLAFVTYASVHPNLDPALIFTSLAFFNLLRQPLMFLPRALSTLTDAQNAIERLTEVFEAEVMENINPIIPSLDVAIRVKGATFRWSSAQPPSEKALSSKSKSVEKVKPGVAKMAENEAESHKQTPADPFTLSNLSLEVPRGRLVGVVGPVGSGKSSILQGLIGEMNNTAGTVEFGGRLAYCQQNAWIQNATLRDNILFGQSWDEHRYWQAITDASLLTDLEILPDGDLTEIGEKGVNLSGGQKQRVNIARAIYFDAEIILFDDPLSAVDAHVGKALFDNAIMGLRKRGKTVLLVTHALHFLPMMDYVYTIMHGQIAEEGTYSDLMRNHGPFCRLLSEFGGVEKEEKKETEAAQEAAIDAICKQDRTQRDIIRLTKKHMGKAAGTGKLEGRLMVSEIRKTGSVGRKVYGGYLRAGRARYTFPLTVLFATLMQTSQVMSTVWLTYWQEEKFGSGYSFYEGIYAMLGLTQAIFTFTMGATMGILSYLASNNLHSEALQNVFYSPMSVFDTQPLGRILGIFGKDIDTIDNQLADSLRMMAMTLVTLLGSIIIITVYFHYFIAIIFGVGVGYWYFQMYYLTSARELKRLDALLRGLLYSHFSESLSGLATIRAYGETARFIHENAYYMDLEDRAYLLTTTNQRWLSVRLDFLGGCLVFAVAIMTAKGGGGLTPSQIALCLTYMVQIVQTFGMVTRQTAECENNMNAVERVLWYANKESLPQESAHQIVSTAPKPSWPEHGEISMNNIVMSYRPGLPAVLKGVSMDIREGEKIGIIGRTGAGKTSITVALYRLAELTSGTIMIDGVDISKIGLNTLRSHIAIIPQDPVLFSGTLRSNLDPFDLYDDAKLYDAMKRACIMDQADLSVQEDAAATPVKRFTLETVIEDEGLNLSVGERSLVSLARALVKDSKIVVLDEATAAVDLETDHKIQATIHREFEGKTLLCIAHRLRTIISWDRILVMNAGEIEEFETPLSLFDNDGLFRSMCDRSSISRQDISKARREERWME